jgi:hypothetical protein
MLSPKARPFFPVYVAIAPRSSGWSSQTPTGPIPLAVYSGSLSLCTTCLLCELIYGIFLSCTVRTLILIIVSQFYDFLLIYPLFSFTLLHP